jgi:hypothetical protein
MTKNRPILLASFVLGYFLSACSGSSNSGTSGNSGNQVARDSDLSPVPQSSQVPTPIDPQASDFVFNLVKKNQDRSGVTRENGGQCSTAYDSGSLDGSPYYAFYTYADTSSNTGSAYTLLFVDGVVIQVADGLVNQGFSLDLKAGTFEYGYGDGTKTVVRFGENSKITGFTRTSSCQPTITCDLRDN